MNSEDLKRRTKQFALDVINLVQNLPKNNLGDIIGRQLLKSATSVAANYRSACRAQSRSHFISKLSIVEEEADESLFWLEVLIESKIINTEVVTKLLKEANELTSIFTASRKTAKTKNM